MAGTRTVQQVTTLIIVIDMIAYCFVLSFIKTPFALVKCVLSLLILHIHRFVQATYKPLKMPIIIFKLLFKKFYFITLFGIFIFHFCPNTLLPIFQKIHSITDINHRITYLHIFIMCKSLA